MSPKRDGNQTQEREGIFDLPEVDLNVEQDTDGLYGGSSFFWDDAAQVYVTL